MKVLNLFFGERVGPAVHADWVEGGIVGKVNTAFIITIYLHFVGSAIAKFFQ